MINFSRFSLSDLKHLLISGVLEFGPIVIFLLSFNHFHIYKATLFLMVATIVSTIITFYVHKRIPFVALYVAFLTIIFGYITITHHQPKFIQIRDTMYDVTCALTLLLGLMINVSFLKIAFQEVLPMTMKAWTNLTYAWIAFFIVMASANEYVRRTTSLQNWFEFKTLAVFVTVIFGFVTLYFFYDHLENKK